MMLDYPILRHQSTNIVYIPTLKAASTYFSKHLKANGFVLVDIDQVDLVNNHLFSHIMDPKKRRNKGIAEFFYTQIDFPNNKWFLEVLFSHNELFGIFQAPYFDSHSAPLHLLYNGFIDQIHFIPIDVESIDYLKLTSDFLSKHGLEIKFPSEKIHRSDSYKIEIFNIVEEHLKSSTQHTDLFKATFAQDFALYQSIIDKFNANRFVAD